MVISGKATRPAPAWAAVAVQARMRSALPAMSPTQVSIWAMAMRSATMVTTLSAARGAVPGAVRPGAPDAPSVAATHGRNLGGAGCAHGQAAGVRAPHRRGAGHPLHPSLVHRRSRGAQVRRGGAGRAG